MERPELRAKFYDKALLFLRLFCQKMPKIGSYMVIMTGKGQKFSKTAISFSGSLRYNGNVSYMHYTLAFLFEEKIYEDHYCGRRQGGPGPDAAVFQGA
jgi:hypothetical protein